MVRHILVFVVATVLPFVVYWLYLKIRQRRKAEPDITVQQTNDAPEQLWNNMKKGDVPWPVLLMTGLILAFAVLGMFMDQDKLSPSAEYNAFDVSDSLARTLQKKGNTQEP